MKKRILWLVISSLMALFLVMAACTPAATPPTPATPTAPTTPTTPTTTATPTAPTQEKPQQEAASLERPKYGGTINVLQGGEILYFDAAKGGAATFPLTNDMLFTQSWAKGPLGTGEDDFSDAMVDPKLLGGAVAESWEYLKSGHSSTRFARGSTTD